MSNEMELFGGGNVLTQIEALPEDVQEALLDQLEKKRTHRLLQKLTNENEALRHEMDRMRAETDAQFEQLGESVKGALDTAAKRYKGADKYYTRSALGDLFAPAISAQRMSKLLIAVGILSDRDTPYHEYQKGLEPMAKRKPWADYPTWIFHIGKVQAHIDHWLTEHGLYDEFHGTATKNQRDKYVDWLYEEYT